jgi:hypothetical protein
LASGRLAIGVRDSAFGPERRGLSGRWAQMVLESTVQTTKIEAANANRFMEVLLIE